MLRTLSTKLARPALQRPAIAAGARMYHEKVRMPSILFNRIYHFAFILKIISLPTGH